MTDTKWQTRRVLGGVAAATALALAASTGIAAAESPASRPGHSKRVQLEDLDRGLVAAVTGNGVFLSWRLLGEEVTGSAANGMAGADFRVYRGRELIATVTDSTNYLDAAGDGTSTYRVAAVVNGREKRVSKAVSPSAQSYRDLPLQKPADGVTPTGEAYTYAANDMSVGDVDGDGVYEYVVKWDPSNSKDVSQVGYTGPVYIDTYRADGTLLHRLDLGVNIRAGAHYTQFMVYDFDGDGRSEMMLKTAPGTKTIRYDKRGRVVSERFITMPRRDRKAGYSHTDDYRLSTAGLLRPPGGDVPGLVASTPRWWRAAGRPRSRKHSASRRAYDYPLSRGRCARRWPTTSSTCTPRAGAPATSCGTSRASSSTGRSTSPSSTGATGRELQTVDYKPGRHDDGLMWGDYALARIEPGNRVDRFLAGVAYLDGKHPSAVFARGYYTRSTLVAYDWDGRRLHERWYVDSGWTPMTNPFNDSPHGRDGTDPEFETLTTQGFHSLSAADVDGDGKHEIVYGSATIDHDGSLLYSSFATLPEGSASPGTTARLGHGDAMHVTDIDPDRPGLEIFTVHEGATVGSVRHGDAAGRRPAR